MSFCLSRIRTVTAELASQGHNVTSISGDVDQNKIENLHYLRLDKIYGAVHNKSEEDKFDFVEIGQLSPWLTMFSYYGFYFDACDGAMESVGFQQLLDYPDDFKV